MRSTPEPVDPLLTRPLGDLPARRPGDASQAASGATPRRISESVFELDGKWFTKVPLPGQTPSSRPARLAAPEHTGDSGHGMAVLDRQLSRAIVHTGGRVASLDKGRTAASLSEAGPVALPGT